MLERLRGTGQATAKKNTVISDIEASIFELEQRIQKLKLAKNIGESANRSDGNAPAEGEQVDINYQIKQLEDEKDELYKTFDSNLSPYEIVKISRHPLRPLTTDYINMLVDDFVELHGDRHFGDDKAIICGLGKIGEKKNTFSRSTKRQKHQRTHLI